MEATWQDGFSAVIKIESFRDACPCADCTENKQKPVSTFVSLETMKPGKYLLKSLSPVGNYALTPVWQDGHDTGIYPFDFVREIFEKNAISSEKMQEIINFKEKLKNN